MSALPTDLAVLGSLCRGALDASAGFVPLMVAIFVAGLAGGVSHCAAMCGPLVLAQVAGLPAPACAQARIVGGLRLPYHLGRIATYALLGGIVALAGRSAFAWFRLGATPAAILLGVAAFIVGAAAIGFGRGGAAGSASRWMASQAGRLGGAGFGRALKLGLVLGLLPCGMVYAGLAVAASTANPWRGAALMASFGLGTAPGLMAIGTIGRAVGLRFLRRWNSLPLAIDAALLSALAIRAWTAG